MKIIFSRKGFDSTAGGFASPIFPDGTLFSIPIPSTSDDFKYSDISFRYQGEPIQSVINDITNNRIKHNNKLIACNYLDGQQHCHHDPMLIPNSNRLVVGQAGNSESHLRNQGVNIGDIFLFYGWFRRVEKLEGRWQYSQYSPDIHLIWSWMEIDKKLDAGSKTIRKQVISNYPYLQPHPHFCDMPELPYLKINSVYLSRNSELLNYSRYRQLTDCKMYSGRSTWRLPACFNQPKAFTFLKNFMLDGDDVIINFKGYGQEFVLDLDKVLSELDKADILAYFDNYIYKISSETPI